MGRAWFAGGAALSPIEQGVRSQELAFSTLRLCWQPDATIGAPSRVGHAVFVDIPASAAIISSLRRFSSAILLLPGVPPNRRETGNGEDRGGSTG